MLTHTHIPVVGTRIEEACFDDSPCAPMCVCVYECVKKTYKRDLQKKPTKQTYKTDLQNRQTKETYERDLQKRTTKENYKREL